jgi:uncharacterized tellurite resistance protein B-like protein
VTDFVIGDAFMLEIIKKFFTQATDLDERSLEKDNTLKVGVATCALFLEMAHIDGEFDERERAHILHILKKQFAFSEEQVASIMKAANEELEGSIDLWRFTSLINENYTVAEKIQVIEEVWRIAYADGHLDKHEDYLVHKMADLLRLTHKQLIDAKLRVLASAR